MNQLKQNTYTICESTEQCKELFEWAKANGVKCESIGYLNDGKGGDKILLFDNDELWSFKLGYNPTKETLMPLPEFISRLKGEWVDGKTVTISEKLMTELECILQDEAECSGNEYAAEILSKIKEQLNNQ